MKDIFSKWWFWVIIAAVFVIVVTDGESDPEEVSEEVEASESEIEYHDELWEYVGRVERFADDLSKNFDNFSILMGLVADDPYVLANEEWAYLVVDELIRLENNIEKYRSLQPTPESEQLHMHLMNAMDHYQYVVDYLPTAIDNMDLPLLERISSEIGAGKEDIGKAAEEKRRIEDEFDR